jgi:4a-hydroxytetrahydrobiopterin dehydratase
MGEHVGLLSRKCQPAEGLQLLDETRRERYRQQVPGWRIQSSTAGIQCIRQEWTARDGEAAQQLVSKLQEVAQQLGHPLTHTDVVGSTVVAEVTSTPAGGLTDNDFIVAAHINALNVADLLQKRKARFWA